MRNESVNNQGVKLKNHKFWLVNSPSGAEFYLAPKLMHTLSRTLNSVSETSPRVLSIANSLQTKFCPFMQMQESKQFSRQHNFVYFSVKRIGAEFQFKLNWRVSGQMEYAKKGE